jgi:hypothetical protein
VLEPLLAKLAGRQARFVQPHARRSIPFNLFFDPEEYLGVDRLRTGVTAPQATCNGREQKQGQRRNHQQAGQVDEILRIEDQAEDVETARFQIEQHGLPRIPLEPRQAVETICVIQTVSQRQREKTPDTDLG